MHSFTESMCDHNLRGLGITNNNIRGGGGLSLSSLYLAQPEHGLTLPSRRCHLWCPKQMSLLPLASLVCAYQVVLHQVDIPLLLPEQAK